MALRKTALPINNNHGRLKALRAAGREPAGATGCAHRTRALSHNEKLVRRVSLFWEHGEVWGREGVVTL
jgi:hypothetical protein